MSFFDFLSRKNANTARKKAEKAALQGGKRAYLLNEETPFTVTEAFRSLKMTLSVSLARQHDGTGASFLCTSSYPSEGKTTVAANTALMLAQSNVKVVLVDTDLRAGRLSKFFNVPHAPGLSDYLSGQATLEEVLRPTEISPKSSLKKNRATRSTITADIIPTPRKPRRKKRIKIIPPTRKIGFLNRCADNFIE